jgi:hypothetical protein
MTRVPAVCDNCGAFFASPFDVNAQNATFFNISVGPCPRCAGQGHIPDGTYSFVGSALKFLGEPQHSRTDLERLAAILATAKKRGASAEEVRRSVDKEIPEFGSLISILPKTRSELYTFITILISILALFLGQLRTGSKPKVEIDQVFNHIIEVSADATSQSRSTPEHSGPYKGVGRNDPCPCGSGKKYKRCHMGRPGDFGSPETASGY